MLLPEVLNCRINIVKLLLFNLILCLLLLKLPFYLPFLLILFLDPFVMSLLGLEYLIHLSRLWCPLRLCTNWRKNQLFLLNSIIMLGRLFRAFIVHNWILFFNLFGHNRLNPLHLRLRWLHLIYNLSISLHRLLFRLFCILMSIICRFFLPFLYFFNNFFNGYRFFQLLIWWLYKICLRILINLLLGWWFIAFLRDVDLVLLRLWFLIIVAPEIHDTCQINLFYISNSIPWCLRYLLFGLSNAQKQFLNKTQKLGSKYFNLLKKGTGRPQGLLWALSAPNMWWSYLITSHGELFVILFEFENMVVMNFPNCRWIVKKLYLNLWCHGLFLFVALSSYLEACYYLYEMDKG